MKIKGENMKWNFLLMSIMLLILATGLVSCQTTEVSKSATSEPATVPEAVPSPTKTSEPATVPIQASEEEVQTVTMDPTISNLVNKGSVQTNYNYIFTTKIRRSGEVFDIKTYDVYVKDKLVKKVYSQAVKLSNNNFYDQLFIDNEAKTAVGICTHSSVSCQNMGGKAIKLSYDQEKFVLPVDLITAKSFLTNPGVKKAGNELFTDRQAMIVEYPVTGGKEKISIDTYYGIPLKWDVYSINGDEEVLQQEFTFIKLNVNGVKESEMILPAGYVLQK